jgi:hypothetical protein
MSSEIIPIPSLELRELHRMWPYLALATHQLNAPVDHSRYFANFETVNHTIFEGTSEIQQLVIARAISGMRIE